VSSPLVLCLFMGAAMSITAIPVLARILTERNLHKTSTAVLALTCAAMDDVMGWCILAFVWAGQYFCDPDDHAEQIGGANP
jgi:Kef-type K+ transport system membrane component KefB